jgi:hypothetical protein
VRIRLYEYDTLAGNKRYAVEVTAWNAWAGQAKILFVAGGLERRPARAGFKELAEHIRDYDWMEGEFVLETDER